MADATRELKVVISSDSKQAEDNLSSFGGSLKRVGEIAAGIGLEKVAESVINFGKAFVTSSIKSFGESQKVTAQLDAVLKSTNNTIGVSRDELLRLSSQLQSTTTYSDEAVLSSENLLLTFTKVGKQVFPDATKAVLDMSTALGQDTKSSAIQLGKALNDPIVGITALRRVGVAFSEDQRNVIESLVKSGDLLKAQKLILEEVSREFGGSAAAAAETFDGKLRQLGNSIDDIKERFGGVIVDAITPFLAKVAEIANNVEFWDNANKKLSETFQQVMAFLSAVFAPVIKDLNDLWTKHHDLITLVGKAILQLVGFGLVVLILGLAQLIEAIIKVIDWFMTIWEWLNTKIPASLKTAGAFFAGLGSIVKNIASGIIADVKNMVNNVIGAINGLIDGTNSLASKLKLPQIPRITPLASGTGYFGGGMALVGENGPELVNLPRGSSVLSADKTANAVGTTVNIYNPTVRDDSDISEIIDQIKRVLGRDNELARLGAY